MPNIPIPSSRRPTMRIGHEERKASWLELYFDLFFVAIIGLISHNFSHDLIHHWMRGSFIQFIIQITAVWRMWTSMTYYFERFETYGLTKRLFIFIQMFLVAGMALTIEQGLAELGSIFFGLYGVSKAMLAAMFWRARNGIPKGQRRVDNINIVANSLVFIAAIIGLFVDPTTRLIIFIVSLVLDIIIPLFHKRYTKNLPSFSSDKFNERFGLFIIIVIGEAIISVIKGIDTSQLSSEILWIGAGALMLSFGHRWMYFDFVSRAKIRQKMIYQWSYLHLPLVIGYTMVGASILTIIQNIENVHHDSLIVLILACMAIMILIGILERLVEEHIHNYVTKWYHTLQIFISAGLMGFLLLDRGLQPIAYIWVLAGLVFLPIILRTTAFAIQRHKAVLTSQATANEDSN